jgi:hypothetical protein
MKETITRHLCIQILNTARTSSLEKSIIFATKKHQVPLSHFAVTKHILETSVILRFQIIAAAGMMMAAYWDVAPCIIVEADRRFRGAYCVHHRPDGSSTHL